MTDPVLYDFIASMVIFGVIGTILGLFLAGATRAGSLMVYAGMLGGIMTGYLVEWLAIRPQTAEAQTVTRAVTEIARPFSGISFQAGNSVAIVAIIAAAVVFVASILARMVTACFAPRQHMLPPPIRAAEQQRIESAHEVHRGQLLSPPKRTGGNHE